MSKTGERMLELLSLLQARHRWSGQELADRLEVSERTLRRDVDRLRTLGYPVRADRGLDGGYQLGVGTKLPPLLLSDDEAVAIAVGLRTAADQPIAGIGDSSMAALVKLGQLLSPTLQRQVESIAEGAAAPSPATRQVALGTLTTLARASRDAERVRFDYRGRESDLIERHVEPHDVVPLDRRWYLLAWDLERDDWRCFRLDRIATARSTNRAFTRREIPAADAATYVRETIAELKAVHEVTLVVETPIDTVRRHIGPWASAEDLGDGATRIEMRIPDLGWAALMLAMARADIRAVEPAELRSFLHDLAQRFLAVTATEDES